MSDFGIDFNKDSADDPAPGPGMVRRQEWRSDGPAELELSADVGRIRVHLEDQPDGAGEVRASGRAGWAGVRTGSGNATLDAVDGDADVTTGSGAIDLGPVSGRARLRTGSGAVRVAATGGTTEIKTGSGDVTVGEVNGDVGLRTGSGDVVVSDARSGALQITTGSGGLRVGVHPGVGAELDLTSGSGRARSELEVATSAPERPAAVQVRGRTGSGDVLVTRATVPA